jgi:uncharacterized protein (TIGR02246 family)
MELQSLPERYKTAVLQKDLVAYASIFDEQVLVFDMWEHWTYNGLASWQEMAKGWFTSLGSDTDLVRYEDIQIHESGELGVITAIMKFTALSEKGEALRYLQNRLTWVARKKDQSWKIIHQHTSSPVEAATMKVILQR